MTTLLEQTKKEIRSVAVSFKNGCTPQELSCDFEAITGDQIPVSKLGFTSLTAFIKAIPDTLTVHKDPDGQVRLTAVATSDIKRVQSLIQKQRSSKKSSRGRGGRRSWRPPRGGPASRSVAPRWPGRGSFRGRGRPSYRGRGGGDNMSRGGGVHRGHWGRGAHDQRMGDLDHGMQNMHMHGSGGFSGSDGRGRGDARSNSSRSKLPPRFQRQAQEQRNASHGRPNHRLFERAVDADRSVSRSSRDRPPEKGKPEELDSKHVDQLYQRLLAETKRLNLSKPDINVYPVKNNGCSAGIQINGEKIFGSNGIFSTELEAKKVALSNALQALESRPDPVPEPELEALKLKADAKPGELDPDFLRWKEAVETQQNFACRSGPAPIDLDLGGDCLYACVSALYSLSRVSLQLVRDDNLLSNLEDSLRHGYSKGIRHVTKPEVGCYYVYRNIIDGSSSYVRAQVSKVDGDLVTVVTVDREERCTDSIDNLFPIWPGYIKALPKQAFQCSLLGLEQYPSQFAEGIIKDHVDLITDSEFVVNVVYNTGRPRVELFYTEETEEGEQELSLNNLLEASVPDSLLTPNLPKDLVTVAFCCWVADDGAVFVQLGSSAERLDAMHAAVAQGFSQTLSQEHFVTRIDAQETYFAKSATDNVYYRAKVIDTQSTEETVKVLFVDYGNEEVVPRHALRHIPANVPSATNLPFQALRLELAGSAGYSAADWKPEVLEQLRVLVLEFIVEVKPKAFDGEHVFVELKTLSSAQPESVNRIILPMLREQAAAKKTSNSRSPLDVPLSSPTSASVASLPVPTVSFPGPTTTLPKTIVPTPTFPAQPVHEPDSAASGADFSSPIPTTTLSTPGAPLALNPLTSAPVPSAVPSAYMFNTPPVTTLSVTTAPVTTPLVTTAPSIAARASSLPFSSQTLLTPAQPLPEVPCVFSFSVLPTKQRLQEFSFYDVSICCAKDPSEIWVSTDDDLESTVKLDTDMLSYYKTQPPTTEEARAITSLQAGDLAAACVCYPQAEASSPLVCYHRVVVLQPPQAEYVPVRFVDYGNEESVSFSQLRLLLARFTRFSPATYRCTLAGAVPLENTWSSEAVDFFSNLVRDSEMVLTTLNCTGNDVFGWLSDSQEGKDRWIHDLMIRQGVARPQPSLPFREAVNTAISRMPQ